MQKHEAILMDRDWKFYRGDYPLAPAIDASTTCYATKSESARGAAMHSFYDGDWETVSLPHDYAVKGSAREDGNQAHGYMDRGPAWYRKAFSLPETDRDRKLVLRFDGVATNCTVWVNGHLMGRNFSGFNDFTIDITDVAMFGNSVNVIAVRTDTGLYGTDTEAFEGWWYDGAGIYRHVWLEKFHKVHVAQYGIWVNPKKTDSGFQVPVEVTVENETGMVQKAAIGVKLVSAQGEVIAESVEAKTLSKFSKAVCHHYLEVTDVLLWDLDTPNLYRAEVTVTVEKQLIDTQQVSFGFRTIRFDPDKGFFLNGRPVKIKGTSNHQDHGCLGAGVPDNVIDWRIAKLKEMGCNGYRCAHNTVAPELLDSCDRQGMLVMSENRWFVPNEETLGNVRLMVLRERNHPSIISWSVGNEEPLQCHDRGYRIASRLIEEVKKLDDSRPCTVAANGGFFEQTMHRASDVIGMNYFPWLYDEVHQIYPDKPILSTEASCSNNCRGVYEENPVLNRFTAYDHHAPSFGNTHREAWKYVNSREFIAGMFYWTGFEYRGETKWPSQFAELGMIDANGFPKDNFYLMQALWTDKPMVHLLPHWNWPGKVGKEIQVYAYTNCETVELFLNGHSLGEIEVDPYEQASWMVAYQPGTLKAVAKTGGKVVAEDTVTTTGKPESVQIKLENPQVRANGEEAAMLTVSLADGDGRWVPDSEAVIHLEFEGDCTFLGAGASPMDTTPVLSHDRKLYAGLMQVMVRVGETGSFTVKASCDGCVPAECRVNAAPQTPRAYAPSVQNDGLLTRWWTTVVFDTPRTPENFRHRMPTEPGMPLQLFQRQKGYAMLSLGTAVPDYKGSKKVSVVFEEVTGEAEIWIRHRFCDKMKDRREDDMLKENFVKKPNVSETSCAQYCDNPCEVYYKKTSSKPQRVVLEMPSAQFGASAPITVWAGFLGDSDQNGLTGIVKWCIEE